MNKEELKHKIDDAVDNIKYRTRMAGIQAKNFYEENKTWVLGVGIPLAAKVGYDIVKGVKRSNTVKEEKRLKENFVWDPSKGIYFETRKPMSNSQKVEFARRRDEGEKVEHILNSMKILK